MNGVSAMLPSKVRPYNIVDRHTIPSSATPLREEFGLAAALPPARNQLSSYYSPASTGNHPELTFHAATNRPTAPSGRPGR